METLADGFTFPSQQWSNDPLPYTTNHTVQKFFECLALLFCDYKQITIRLKSISIFSSHSHN